MESPQTINDYTVGCVISENLTEILKSMERLDRSSPELWPEQIPGMQQFTSKHQYSKSNWRDVLDEDDTVFLQSLLAKTNTEVIMEVKRVNDAAYRLGLEESREMTRGRFLKVLETRQQQQQQPKANGVSAETSEPSSSQDSCSNKKGESDIENSQSSSNEVMERNTEEQQLLPDSQ